MGMMSAIVSQKLRSKAAVEDNGRNLGKASGSSTGNRVPAIGQSEECVFFKPPLRGTYCYFYYSLQVLRKILYNITLFTTIKLQSTIKIK